MENKIKIDLSSRDHPFEGNVTMLVSEKGSLYILIKPYAVTRINNITDLLISCLLGLLYYYGDAAGLNTCTFFAWLGLSMEWYVFWIKHIKHHYI